MTTRRGFHPVCVSPLRYRRKEWMPRAATAEKPINPFGNVRRNCANKCIFSSPIKRWMDQLLFPLSCNFTRQTDCMLLETFVLLITTLRVNAGSTVMQLPKICTRKQTPNYDLCPPLADLNDDYYGHCIPLKSASAVATTLASSSGLSEPRPHHLQVPTKSDI